MGNGNFKSIKFGGITSYQPLEVFKPPLNLTMMNEKNDAGMIEPNEKYTHNTQTNIHPTNYTQTNPIIHPMNYTQSNTIIYPMNYTQPNPTITQ